MLKSMTGYARVAHEAPEGRYVVEIQTVNRKHLEIHTHLQREISCFDVDVRKWIAAQLHRGNVNIRISVFFERELPFTIRPNIAYLKQLLEVWKVLGQETGNHAEQFPLSQLLLDDSVLIRERNDENEATYRVTLKNALEKALMSLDAMRSEEGRALQRDLLHRLDTIEPAIRKISGLCEGATSKYKDALITRLQTLGAYLGEMDERILREVALYAEKIDINEELIRLDSHLKQFRDLLNSHGEAVGKTLEFLLQEMHREINTIGSKSSDIEVSRCVVEVKGDLERIREQIQNIE